MSRGSRYFVDLFSRGKWEDSGDVQAVTFKKNKSKFPLLDELFDETEPDKYERKIAENKIIAKEAPRTKRWYASRGFTGGYGAGASLEMYVAGRYHYYSEKKVFPEQDRFGNDIQLRGNFEKGGPSALEASLQRYGNYLSGAVLKHVTSLFGQISGGQVGRHDRRQIVMAIHAEFINHAHYWGKELAVSVLRRAADSAIANYQSVIPDGNLKDHDKRVVSDLFTGALRSFEWSTYAYSDNISGFNKYTPHVKAMVQYANALDALMASNNYQPGQDRRPKLERRNDDFFQMFGAAPKEGPENLWFPTKLYKAPMDKNLAPLEVRDRMMSDCGVVPRRMDRLVTDGKVFERVIPELGASVLIDASGSMDISSETILKVIEAAPASVIALYCGGSGRVNGDKHHQGGFIIVLGENGQAVSDVDPYRMGASNGCDGIGLRWLGMQPEPRFWVSDGQVNGRGGEDVATFKDAAWCLKQFNINWVNTNSPEEIVKIVEDYLREDADVMTSFREEIEAEW